MRVLILGGSGMLGHQLCRLLRERMEIWATLRKVSESLELLPEDRMIDNIAGRGKSSGAFDSGQRSVSAPTG